MISTPRHVCLMLNLLTWWFDSNHHIMRRYSGYRKRGNQAALLRRLAYRLAPTGRQLSGQAKRIARAGAGAEGLARYIAAMRAKSGDLYTDAQLTKMYGKGGYWGKRFGNWLGDMVGNKTILSDAFSSLGDSASSMIPGGDLFAGGAEQLAKAVGWGSYQISQPGAPAAAMQVGTFSQGDVESINIQSREFLGAINGSSPFQLSTLVINPGLLQTFPQLSKLAMHYEQYRFNGLIFWFHSTSGESTNSADTAIGELMMGNQPDSTAQNPINKQQLVRLGSAKQAKPSLDQLHGVECAGAPMKLIRHGDPVESTQDAMQFDFGKFHLAVEGCNAAVTRIGELWVTYDIDLIRSRDSKGQETASYRADWANGSQTNLFSLTAPAVKYQSLPLTVLNNTVTFPQFVCDGDYAIQLILLGTATAGGVFAQRCPLISATSQCSIIQNLGDFAFNTVAPAPGDSSDSSAIGSYCVRVNAPGATQASFTFAPDAIWPSSIGLISGIIKFVVTRVPQDLFV